MLYSESDAISVYTVAYFLMKSGIDFDDICKVPESEFPYYIYDLMWLTDADIERMDALADEWINSVDDVTIGKLHRKLGLPLPRSEEAREHDYSKDIERVLQWEF
jgi:hypothetical protein